MIHQKQLLLWLWSMLLAGALAGQTSLTPTAYSAFCSYDQDQCEGVVTLQLVVSTSCPTGVDDFLLYQTVFNGASNDTVHLPEAYWAQISTDTVQIEAAFAIGTHLIHLSATDNCGGWTNVNLPIEVVDCQPPIFTCNTFFVIDLSPVLPPADIDGNGIVDEVGMGLWAKDAILEQTVYDCSGQVVSTNDPDLIEVTEFNIYRRAELDTLIPSPGGHEGIAFIGCEALGIHELIVYAWDEADNPYAVQPDGSVGGRNWDSCGLVVQVRENFGLCETGFPVLKGKIMNEEWHPIGGVEVILSGNSGNQGITQANGAYQFGPLSAGTDYTITPEYDEGHKNGVSTFDLVLIAKHILGIQSLDSPYKIIAADANNSGSVTTLDLIKIRRLILDIDEKLENNTSWRFLPADFVFPNSLDPWQTTFPEFINIYNVGNNSINFDFIGIKVGDVNGSADNQL